MRTLGPDATITIPKLMGPANLTIASALVHQHLLPISTESAQIAVPASKMPPVSLLTRIVHSSSDDEQELSSSATDNSQSLDPALLQSPAEVDQWRLMVSLAGSLAALALSAFPFANLWLLSPAP